MRPRRHHRRHLAQRALPRLVFAVLALAAGLAAPPLVATPAAAHGFTSVVYVDASAQGGDTIRTVVELEYDLLVSSVARYADAPGFSQDGMDVWKTGEEASALNAYADPIVAYVTKRFAVTAEGAECDAERVGQLTATERDGVPYAVLTLDHDCPPSGVHGIRSALFPDEENYVRDTVTIVAYELDTQTGAATIDKKSPVFSTEQTLVERLGHFFVLGAEHLLFGIDHVLFLLALIVGSRRLRDVVLAATAFTVAHSATFILAAVGLVTVPAAIVEPAIALSIAVVAVWYLWRVWRERGTGLLQIEGGEKPGFSTTDAARLTVVFLFGLLHGVGFAGALGLDEPFSWQLLGSLLVFNVGIEAVQVAIILALFPLLLLLRRRARRTGLVVGIAVAAGVAAMGLVWFVERLLGAG
ncbi:HupE/UreJ family protein [Microbacterium sp. CPCC 204701]|uniref:HupE/UreJ family protein n=1 Tax=Microbacterium sp. CPCC 204701 TaxID=2493084 RepID=UPI000FD73438|nr:HupE/UreJ family protein [Microbacterium sp. CPCC 204701]